MNPRLRKLGSDWKTYMALLSVTAAGLSAFGNLGEGISKTVGALRIAPASTHWIVAGVFVLLTLLLLAAALSRRSVLLQPERFLLSQDDPRHLVGREEEIRNLAEQCRRYTLVFLVGESGSGKTALVRAGLAHGLRSRTEQVTGADDLVPLLVDLSGLGWESGLTIAIARELNRLPADVLKALGASEAPSVQDVFAWFRNRAAHAPRKPLLILDQFDDYLTCHRTRFYDNTTLRRPAEIERNSEWKEIADLLRSGAIHILVVARSDVADSLPAVCFVEEGRIARERLANLQPSLASPILDRITETLDNRPVIDEPESGWLQLRLRLLRDLQKAGGGRVLPVQLAVALNSLRLGRDLTVAAYDRIGGVLGLEQRHIERHAEMAANSAGISTKAVLEALRKLVTPDGTKTRQLDRADFDEMFVRHGARVEAADAAVRQLERDKIIRLVRAAAGGEQAVLLYHDYLARGVHEAYRQADYWNELIREKWQSFTEAQGLGQRWRALLAPTEQVALIWEAMRGRFSFGTRRRFAVLSILRCLPALLAAAAVAVGYWAGVDLRDRQVAAEVMKAVGHTGTLYLPEEATEWRRLYAAGNRAVLHAFDEVRRSETVASRSRSRSDYLGGMVIGLDVDGTHSRKLLEDYLLPTIRDGQMQSLQIAFRIIGSGQLCLSGSANKDLAHSILERLVRQANGGGSVVSGELVDALRFLASNLEREDILPDVRALVERMQEPKDSPAFRQFAAALGALSAKLERTDLVPAARAVAERMKTEQRAWSLGFLAGDLGTMAGKLERADVLPSAQILLAKLRTEGHGSTSLLQLAGGLAPLSRKLEREDILPAAQALIEAMNLKANRDSVSSLGETLAMMAPKLDSGDIVSGVRALLEQMKPGEDGRAFERLGEVLGALCAKLDSKESLQFLDELIDRLSMEWEQKPHSPEFLKFDGARQLLEWMWTRGERWDGGGVRLAMGVLGAKIDQTHAAGVLRKLVGLRIRTSHSLWYVGGAVEALVPLSSKLGRDEILPSVAALQGEIKLRDQTANSLAGLGEVLGAVSGKLEQADVMPVALAILKRMKSEDEIYNVWQLGEALAAFGSKAGQEHLRAGAQVILTRLLNEYNPTTLERLVKTFVRLSATLTSPTHFEPYRNSVAVKQVYVDLLKEPFVVGKARDALLRALEDSSRQAFGGYQSKFVVWATQEQPGRPTKLDLTSAPAWRPALLGDGHAQSPFHM